MSYKSLEEVCKKQQRIRLKAILENRNCNFLPDQDNQLNNQK